MKKGYLFVIPTLSNGGAERVVSVLSSALVRCDREVWIVKHYEKDDEYPVDPRVQVINLSGGTQADYGRIGFWGKVWRLRKTIRRCKPDVVIPFLFSVALYTSFAAKGLGVETIQSIRIDPASGPKSERKRKIRDRLVYRAGLTLVQNESQKRYFPPKYHEKIHVLYNPVSDELLAAEWRPERNAFLVCGVGRLEEQKNFRLLMDAFREAFSDVPEARLRIYGDGSREKELRTYAEGLGMGERIRMMGRCEDMKAVYQQASLFVLSSDFEGMPNALIEAMAVGVPSVSTNCPTGPEDLIRDGENGLLVPVRDVGAMAKAMRAIYDGKYDPAAMSARAKETIRELCSAEKIARQLIEICEGDR